MLVYIIVGMYVRTLRFRNELSVVPVIFIDPKYCHLSDET